MRSRGRFRVHPRKSTGENRTVGNRVAEAEDKENKVEVETSKRFNIRGRNIRVRPRGGGRSSARETACRVVAGAIAKQILKDISIYAYTSSIGNISIDENYE